MSDSFQGKSGVGKLPVVLALLAGLVAGATLTSVMRSRPARADDAKPGHGRSAAESKMPLAEVIHCPLAFAGIHLLKDLPEHPQVAYHYCKPVNDDVSQCI